MTAKSHIVSPEEEGLRIDKLLTQLSPDTSRSQVQSWIKDDLVKIDGETIKSNHKCQPGEEVSWKIPESEPLQVIAEDISIQIVYEDKDLLIINKPRGMVVHPSAGHPSGTLVNALLYHCQELSGINGELRPGIVHRIDKDTSGLLVVAKNDHVHTALVDQLKEKKMERKYKAIVHGDIAHEYGTVDAPIGRHPDDRQKMAVVGDGKSAITHFEVLERFDHYTYILCVLETGRTHQIRVHMQYIDHPVAGDPKYGPRKTIDMGGQALHAFSLSLEHPKTHETLTFTVDPPQEFELIRNEMEKRR